MGVRFPSVASNTLVNASVGINVETIVASTPPLILPLDFAQVIIMWFMTHTIGTTATSSSYRLRRGTALSSTQITGLAGLVTGVAANVVLASGTYFDTPGAVEGVQYSLTCIDNGSTVAGGIQDAAIIAFVL